MRLILCALVVLAWTSGPFFGPKAPTLSAPAPVAPAVETGAQTIDFDSLHNQANEALARLRQAQAADGVTVASAN